MKYIKWVRLVESLSLFLIVGCLILFSSFVSKAQNNSTVECGWMWKWVWELVNEEYYNGITGKYEYRLANKLVYKYVYDCVPSVVKTKPAVSTSRNTLNALAPTGEIQKVWVDYDVSDKQKKGMRIHSKFNVRNLKDKKCTANAYFSYASGKPLKDFNGKFRTTGGKVAAHDDFTPIYASSVFKDFQLFMPYDELHMAMGEHDLKFVVKLHCEGAGFIAQSKNYDFTYTRSK